MKHAYNIECPLNDGWNPFIKGCSLQYGHGYLDAMRGELPRKHLRLVRSDGKIVDQVTPFDEVGIGQVAGWPTAEQYERAANNALEKARKIRDHDEKQCKKTLQGGKGRVE
jgi:hypothetical protein